MKKNFLLVGVFLLFSMGIQAQIYYSRTDCTDFTNPNCWGANPDGLGAAPATISNADNFVIQNGSVMNLNAGNASVRTLTINTGSLTVSSNTLTVAIAGQNNSELNVTSGGTLILNGGTINVNGAVYFANGAGFTHSSGTMNVDANSGTAATSIAGASGTQVLFGIGYSAGSVSSSISSIANALKFSLTGGTVRIIDPSFSSNSASYALANNSSNGIHINAAAAHSFEFGDGVSTTAGGSANGFGTNLNVGLGRLYAGSFLLNAVSAGNRKLTTVNYHGFAGNLTINTGSEIQVTNRLYTAGNIVNDGTLTFLFSSGIYFQSFINGIAGTVSTPQSIGGNGSFKNEIVSTANFGSVTIDNSSATGVTFANANSLLSGSNTGTASINLTLTNGIITTGPNAFILGISTSNIGSMGYTSGGFGPGSALARWFNAASAGTSISAGSDPVVSSIGAYPFSGGGSVRSHFFIGRPTTTGATGGIIKVKYNHGMGLNLLGMPVADGAYSITHQSNASWEVTTSNGFAPGTGTFKFAASAQNSFFASNGNTRVMKVATVPGTHENGTTLPNGHRAALAAADYTGTFYLGINSTDIAIGSAQSGPWEDPNTWVGNVVPTCGISAQILNTHTVTVNGSTANVSNLTTNTGGTLNVTGNTLTVGCVDNNNSLINNGGLNVSGGTLIVNGRVNIVISSVFSQTGGTIKVDGNKAGDISKSVTTGTVIFAINNVGTTLSGGTLILVDPHAGTSLNDDVFRYTSSFNKSATTGHTLQLGDGISTDAGGNTTNGMSVELITGSGGRLMLGNVIVHTVSAGITGNRFVAHRSSIVQILGNLTIMSGRYAPRNISVAIAGNTVNNGEMISTGNILFQSGTDASTPVASNSPQSVSGNGIYANNATLASATANFNSLTFNNNSAGGITLNALNVIPGNPVNTINCSNNLTILDPCRINVDAGTCFFRGTVAAGTTGSFTCTGGGFSSNSCYGISYSATQTGATITAGAEPSNSSPGHYPSRSADGNSRSGWLERVGPNAAGIVAFLYTDASSTTPVSIPDGTYIVNSRFDGKWKIFVLAGNPTATSYKVALSAQGAFDPLQGNTETRCIYATSVIGSSSHIAGTATPTGQRDVSTLSDLTSSDIHVGINTADQNTPAAKLAWAISVGGTTNEEGLSIALDKDGNSYATGCFSGTVDFDPGPGTFNLTSAGGEDIFVTKFNSTGELVWAKRYGGTGDDCGTSLLQSSFVSGTIISGYFQGTVDFGDGPKTAAGGEDAFIIRLDQDGIIKYGITLDLTANEAALFVKKHVPAQSGPSSETDSATTSAVPDGICLIGIFSGTVDFDPGPAMYNLVSAGDRDIFVLKLDTAGNFIWAKNMGGIEFDAGNSIAIDESGNVYITGLFSGTADFDPGAGIFNLISTGPGDMYICKLDPAGNFVWAKNIGDVFYETAASIKLDPSGNVYTTGNFSGIVDFDPGGGTNNLTSAGSSDIFILKLNASGNFLWAKNMGGVSADLGNSIAVDGSGHAYTTGYFSGTADFDPGSGTYNLVSAGPEDIFISQLDPSGNFVWALRMGGSSNDIASSIAVGDFGKIYTTGKFAGTGDFNPGLGMFNLTSAGGNDIFVVKLHQDLVWAGSVSNVWSNPANWLGGLVPGISSHVLIPSGLARYPTVFSSVEIKSLVLQNGATVTVRPTIELKINGKVL